MNLHTFGLATPEIIARKIPHWELNSPSFCSWQPALPLIRRGPMGQDASHCRDVRPYFSFTMSLAGWFLSLCLLARSTPKKRCKYSQRDSSFSDQALWRDSVCKNGSGLEQITCETKASLFMPSWKLHSISIAIKRVIAKCQIPVALEQLIMHVHIEVAYSYSFVICCQSSVIYLSSNVTACKTSYWIEVALAITPRKHQASVDSESQARNACQADSEFVH